MNDHVFRDASEPAFLGVVHLLDIVNALCIIVEKLDGNPDRIAGMQFAQIGDVRLEREKRSNWRS